MNKYEKMDKLLDDNNGYLATKDVEELGISRTYLASYVKENSLERVTNGIYISPETFEDKLYILQMRYPRIIFSGETALYLHGLIDREYSKISVTVPPGFNRTRLCEEGIDVHQENEKCYSIGIVEIKTNYGNVVKTYDKERCICDIVTKRNNMDVQHFQTAMKTYMRSKDKDLNKLVKFAEALGVRDEVMKYIEVMT